MIPWRRVSLLCIEEHLFKCISMVICKVNENVCFQMNEMDAMDSDIWSLCMCLYFFSSRVRNCWEELNIFSTWLWNKLENNFGGWLFSVHIATSKCIAQYTFIHIQGMDYGGSLLLIFYAVEYFLFLFC